MTLRDDLGPVFDEGRALAAELGLRQRTVIVRTITRGATGKASLRSDAASDTPSDVTLTPTPRVRDAVTRAWGKAGLYEEGDLVVDRLSYAAYDRAALMPDGGHWVIDGKPFEVVSLEEQNFQWRAVVRRRKSER